MKKNITILITMLITIPLWLGCSNETDGPVAGKYDGKPIPVLISVGKINSGVQTRSETQKRVFSEPLNKLKDTGFDVVTTIEAVPDVETRNTSPLVNAKYRLLAYRVGAISSANFAGQGDYETDATGKGTPIGTQLFLPAGDYTFLCYTFGNSTDIPVFSGTGTLISVTQGQDFMTCIQNVTVADSGDGTFTADNNFNRQCSQITVEVSAAGFPDDEIKVCAVALNNINDNLITWDFSTATVLPNTGTSGSANFAWTTLNDTVVTSESQIVFPISARSLSAVMTNLTIGSEVLNGATFSYPNVEFAPAGKYKVSIAIERNYIPVGGYKWAKGNVYKSTDGNFYIESTQASYHPGIYEGSYFEWNTLETGLNANNKGDYTYATDPCSKIAPAGTWQTPSRTEAVALTATWEWDGPGKGIWFGAAPNRVFLPAMGMRAYNGNSAPMLNNDGKYAMYALRDYSGRYTQAISFEVTGVYWPASVQRTHGLPIRCIRKS